MKKLLIPGLLLLTTLIHGQPWYQMDKVAAPDRQPNDQFGFSVDLSGNYAIIGAHQHDYDIEGGNYLEDAGAAYIFERVGCEWVFRQKLVNDDREALDLFGYQVALEGDYAIVGALWQDYDASGNNFLEDAGAVYVFKRNGSTWSQVNKITAPERAAFDNYGVDLAMSGIHAVVGAYREDEDAGEANSIPNAGAAYILKLQNGAWSAYQKIVSNSRDGNDNFGISVGIDGSHIVVTAWGDQQDASEQNPLGLSGAAYVFEPIGGTWTQTQKIVSSDRAYFDRFGQNADIHGDFIFVGAPLEDHDVSGNNFVNGAGSAYVFQKQSGIWVQTQKLVYPERNFADQFGHNVVVSDQYAIVNNYRYDFDCTNANTFTDSGTPMLYERVGSEWVAAQKLCREDFGASDFFSLRIALDEDMALISCSLDDEDAEGLNALNNTGSAYFFRFSGGPSCEGTIDVCEAIDDLIEVIEDSGLANGIRNSLTSKLNNARNQYANGHPLPARNMLMAFIHELQAEAGEQIDTEQAAAWIESAMALVEAIDSENGECGENQAALRPQDDFGVLSHVPDGLALSVTPNPSPTAFTLRLSGKSGQPHTVRVYNAAGKMLDQFTVSGDEDIRVGMDYSPGIYLAVVETDETRKTITLIKHRP